VPYSRLLDLAGILARKSAFLLGPRSSGKTYLYTQTLSPDRVYNLLDRAVLKRLTNRPGLIYEECTSRDELIVIDEVQKIPDLLDEVHRTIEDKAARFLLTGSSARKLKRTQANLLGGRATRLEMFPLVSREIPEFDLLRYLNHGGIPRHYDVDDAYLTSELDDYVSLYLKEEIKDEAVTRKLDAFSRFLDVMALHSGDELAIESFASDCQVKATTFRNYIEVLEDTLIGFKVAPFTSTAKRKAITRSKFYLFDVGITNYLAHRLPIMPKSEAFGKSFEHLIALELRAFLALNRLPHALCYWRSTSQMEVDFIVGTDLAIEVKASSLVVERDLRGLKALREEGKISRLIVVSMDPSARQLSGIDIMPWFNFLQALWRGDLITNSTRDV
jgi:predicted AAA+ superfamily ATPase